MRINLSVSGEKIVIIIFILLLNLTSLTYSQAGTEKWLRISGDDDQITYIDIAGLSAYKGNEIFIWALQDLNSPISMEEVDGDIYKVRTYYHINLELKRYGIVQIIFYDSKSNVLKQYNYGQTSDKPEFIFGYPVIPNSDIDKIVKVCREYLNVNSDKK